MSQIYRDIFNKRDGFDARGAALATFVVLGEKLKRLRGSIRKTEARGVSCAKPANDDQGAIELYNAIENEIIPKLLLAHRTDGDLVGGADASAASSEGVSDADRDVFVETVLRGTSAECREAIARLEARGVGQKAVFLDLFAPSARRLGEMWDEDLCDFTQVTVGLCRLHQMLREHGVRRDPEEMFAAPRVLVATLCGDQHVFGAMMVSEFFERAGWAATCAPGIDSEALHAQLKQTHFDLVGLSAARDFDPSAAAAEIAAMRAKAQNADLKILVGGRMFSETPDLAPRIGADAIAFDAETAPLVGDELLANVAARC